MHIVLFFTFDYSLKTWFDSGHITRELKFYNYLIEKGIKVSFVTYGDMEDLKILKNTKIDVYPIYSLTKKSKFKFINILKSIFLPIKLKKKIDLSSQNIIVKQNQLMGSWVSIIFKFLINGKIYTRTGYDMYLFSIKENKGFVKKLLYFLLTQITILFSNYYSVTSKSDQTFLRNKFLGAKNIIVRPNWVDVEMDSKQQKYEDRLLAVGRLEKQKNFSELLHAVRETGFSVDIYGEGSLKEELIEVAKKLEINLNIYNNVENEQLLDIYKKYKYFVSSSIFEGNSKVVLEALANGCLVIAKDIENNREIIGDDCGLLYKKNLNELLIKCQNRELEVSELTKNASNKIRKTYSREKVFSDYLSDFKNITKN